MHLAQVPIKVAWLLKKPVILTKVATNSNTLWTPGLASCCRQRGDKYFIFPQYLLHSEKKLHTTRLFSFGINKKEKSQDV